MFYLGCSGILSRVAPDVFCLPPQRLGRMCVCAHILTVWFYMSLLDSTLLGRVGYLCIGSISFRDGRRGSSGPS